jgi:uncharacterized protein DUF5977
MLFKRIFFVSLVILTLASKPFAQVNLQTGSAVFSLPMFNWQDDKSLLTSVVALSYSSGNGLKVNDLASNVGQGWNLVAGGVITRMQMGEPDDQPVYTGAYPNYGDQDITKYPPGFLYDTVAVGKGCPNALTKYPTYGSKNTLYAQHNSIGQDKEQDYFSFQFNGKSGMFVLDTVGGGRAVLLGDTKMKISFQLDNTMAASQGIRTTITSFTITDVDGLIYKFTLHGLTRILKTSFSSFDGTKQAGEPKIGNQNYYCQSAFDLGPTASPWYNQYMANPFIISNWYLSEIDDPFTSRKILFTYNSLNLSNSAGVDISYNKSLDNYIIVSYKKSITTVMEIASISYPDGHLVSFNYSSSSRVDYYGQKALANVSISYNGRYLSQYQLNTTYFILNRYGTPATIQERYSARLCLKSVQKIGVDLKEDSPPYIFDYYKGSSGDDIVPPPFFYVKDIWGYYNGNNSIASNSPLTGSTIPVNLTASPTTIPGVVGYYGLKGLCFQNDNVTGIYYNPKPGYAQNGLLKQIVYPTGGNLTYQYAQNTGSFIGSSSVMNVGGVHVSQTSSSDGGYSNGCGTPIVTQYNYVMNGTGSASSLWGLETPVNSVASNNSWNEERKTIHFSFAYPFGTCLWHYVYPGIMSQSEAVSLDEFQKIMVAIAPVLGILSVVSTINDIIAVCGPETGVGEIVAIILDVISAILTYALACPQQSKYTPNTVFYNFDLNEISPLPAQFKRVEITESPGTIGKTVQQFTQGDQNTPNGPDYYPIWYPNANTTFSPKQRFAPWAYGLPWLTTVYDVNGNKIKETQNVYDFTYAQEPIGYNGILGSKNVFFNTVDCKCQVINNYSQRSDNWSNPVSYNDYYSYVTPLQSPDLGVDFYYMFTGRTQLDSTYERVYRVSDVTQFVQTATGYEYNSDVSKGYTSNMLNYDPFLITTLQSNGDINFKNIKYSSDYNTGILATIVSKNMVSLPVATVNYVQKSGSSTSQYLSEKVTEFTQLANSDVKPSRILEQRFATPASTFTPYSGPTTTNYSLYKIPQTFTYDGNYNLTGLQDEGGRNVTNIYDYNDKYIVASVINANSAIDKPAYTSFESLDLTRSGWVVSGIASYNQNSPSVTGVNNFAMLSSGGNSLTASSLNTATAYILSFWANNGNVTVTGGATLTKSSPTNNGFTYYEYNIAQGTVSVVLKDNTTTNANIDELRLYPVNSRMRTTTYDPLIGKTSECDENNRITYYAYDNLGRLQFVKDEVNNIVKMYEYNNVSSAKQIGCPVTFTNPLISEVVTRNNCSAGYQGGAVTYTVAANTYSSSISQLDADIQADINMLTNAQNYANSNGSCSLIYYNVAVSETDTTRSCGPGSVGGPVTYTVPANTYSSIISQADANQQAYNDTAANAQAYINSPFNASCPVSTVADWEWFPGDGTMPADPSYCLSVNGNLPPHQFVLATDVNPNSSTYNQTKYYDYGPTSACPANTYYDSSVSQVFTRNNCGTGYTGGTYTYTVPPGKYSSTTSQAAAQQLALNDISANGQNAANTYGTCISSCSFAANTGFGIVTSGISSSGSTVNFNIVFYPSASQFNVGNSYQIATINGGCKPSASRNVTVSSSGRTWIVTVYTGGQFYASLQSGSPLPVNQTTSLSGSYPL